MKKSYFFLILALASISVMLLNNIFFGDKSYEVRNQLQIENEIQLKKNEELKKENEILEFEINNAKNSDDHIENFARENLNLSYPNEEFITFEEIKELENEKK